MNKFRWLYPLVKMAILVLLLSGAVSCAGAADAGPQVWIDAPSDGMSYAAGETVSVISHAYARAGIAEVVLSVNGEAYRRDPPPSSGAEFIQVIQDWQPAAAGIYAIQVVAYDMQGTAGSPATITIKVKDSAPTPVVVCPSPVGGGPTPVSCLPKVSGCPSPVGGGPTPPSCPTLIISVTPVITDTPTLPPPATSVIQFWADPAQIPAGACTTMRWHVENAQRVIFGGIDQPFDGSYEDCLCEDERYSLTVILPDGTEEKHRVDIDVIGSCVIPTTPPPPQDTTPPPVPGLSSPSNGSQLNCITSQTLTWQQVKDPSGIKTYYIKLEQQVKGGQWQSAGGFTSAGGSVNVAPPCGYSYRWTVRAEDGAGNYSDWSAYSTFLIYPPIQ